MIFIQSGRFSAITIFGDNGAGITNGGFSPDFIWGKGYQASQTFTANSIHCRIADGQPTISDFRLGVYNATDANTWGSLAGISVPRGGGATNSLISLPLEDSISIISGQWYAPFVHSFSGSAFLRTREETTGRYVSDVYSNGTITTAGVTTAAAATPLVWLSSEVIAPETSDDIIFGPISTDVGNTSFSGGFSFGLAQVCNIGGTVNFLYIVGSSASSSSVDYRLVLYEATGPFTWGNKIAETAIMNGLGIAETKKGAVILPVVIQAGRYYALVVQAAGTLPVRAAYSFLGRSMPDSFADGAITPADATSDFGAVPLMGAMTMDNTS